MDVSTLFSLSGANALVTGGSRGIGAMIAQGLIGAGADVFICGRKEKELMEAAERLGAMPLVADLSTDAGVEGLAKAMRERVSRLDILVNNAGAAWGAPFDAFPRSGFDKVLNLNVVAVFALTQALHPLLKAAASPEHPARVINISSIDGLTPPRGPTFSYSASKAALNMLTRHLASIFAADHITCNAIAPGLFETKFSAHMFDPGHPKFDDRPLIPMNRAGNPEDIAGAAIYLASRAGGYVTGAILPVSGGSGCFQDLADK
ncbi:MAG: 3-oxoacyl-ACP reductase [Rhizobiales bacterium 65-9]|nr:SDR family oxidoreductase [Hyphomicrobiales bacterium]OJY32184.1 MAG: 3-oxoacyl-ACP reductase [Rhizobiales bacterium 65-9]